MEQKNKEKILRFRVNEEEYNKIKKKAESCNLTMSKYLRDMAFKKIIIIFGSPIFIPGIEGNNGGNMASI